MEAAGPDYLFTEVDIFALPNASNDNSVDCCRHAKVLIAHEHSQHLYLMQSIGSGNGTFSDGKREAAAIARAGLFVLFGSTGSHASEQLLNGFFAANPSGCFSGTGVLYVCNDGQCTSRAYKDTGALSPTTAFTDTIVAKSSGTNSNGIVREAGDITLRYQSYGADYLKIVRPAGQMLITT